ncbi:N-acetyltransferase [Romboutsia weinsteinii]|uniref:N-acetyltransferase n=1 Tax=Romboutsia weinsteinii TaxID=2020949 RepID=A0A371J632_9FIRM|nr:GNAT family N-acetyltransferase [Romboutsia weinsteinii]RDY28137.1 N-acetyltransferase [Romboutsia weinsteinii]
MNNNYFIGYILMRHEDIVALSVGAKKPWINGMEYYIDQFCVKESLQGNGVGSKFLSHLMKQ